MSSVPRSKTFIPEIVEPLPPDLMALTRFARLMDEAVAVPGTNPRGGVRAPNRPISGRGGGLGRPLSAWLVLCAPRRGGPRWARCPVGAHTLLYLPLWSCPPP